MGKTYIDTVKYVVYSNVEIDGLVEKPDVVGAIFGQTEGLLGDDLDLRELQKNGRIGRIEVDLKPKGGKSIGSILLPSSLDMVETSILAAALETVDRVGPCDAKIKVEKIEDTRNAKRRIVINRAKDLLKNLLVTEIPESREISELVRQEVKIAEITEFGSDKLPSGPGIESQEAIILVEGRADVLNLLKHDIENVVAVGGANVPPTLAALAKEKEVTAFLDGDRGGDIILRELSNALDIDFVARAPAGKEVEELSRKELIKCLRSRIPIEQAVALKGRPQEDEGRRRFQGRERPPFRREEREQRPMPQQAPQMPVAGPEPAMERQPAPQEKVEAAQLTEVPKVLLDSLNELENTLRARIYDEGNGLKNEIPVRDLIKTLSEIENPYSVVFDGIITQRLVDLCEEKGAKILVGVKMGNVFRRPEKLLVATKE